MIRAMRHLRLLLILFGYCVSGMYRLEFICAGILNLGTEWFINKYYWLRGLSNFGWRVKIFWALSWRG